MSVVACLAVRATFREDETLRIVTEDSLVHAHWYDGPREGQSRTVGRAERT